MLPAPLTTALPKLAALIDDQRPLISAALLDLRVTQIDDTVIHTDVLTQHSYDLLTSKAQQDYLDTVLSRYFNRAATFSFTLSIEPPASSIQHQESSAKKRTANTLTFTERAALQNWMSQDENRAFVANESDVAAADKATLDLSLMVTAMAGSESDCKPAFPRLIITPGNIASMRKILGIEKVKPVKPAPAPVHDIDLVALHAQVQQHHLQLDPIAGVNIAEVLSNLRNSLFGLENRVKSLEASAD